METQSLDPYTVCRWQKEVGSRYGLLLLTACCMLAVKEVTCMRLKDISINNLRRRKGKVFFLILGLTIGITTVVTLISITRMMNEDISKKLDEFGANILIIPRSDDLSLSYEGMSIGGIAIDAQTLKD